MSSEPFLHKIRRQALTTPDRLAISTKEVAVSYSAMLQKIYDLSDNFAAQGIRHRDLVAVHGLSPTDSLLCFLALANLGATTIFLQTLSASQVQEQLADFYVTPDEALATHATVIAPHRLTKESSGPSGLYQGFSSGQDIAAIFGSSGSTGKPKFYGLTADLLALRCEENTAMVNASPSRIMVNPPPSTTFGLQAAISALSEGHTFVSPRVDQRISTVFAGEVDIVISAPRFFRELVREFDRGRKIQGGQLCRCFIGGSKISPWLAQRVLDDICRDAKTLYGSTEAGIVSFGPLDEVVKRPDYVGHLQEYMSLSTLNEQGQRQDALNAGQLIFDCTSVRGLPLFFGNSLEKLRKPAPPLNVCKVGDIGFVDADGRLYLSSRVNEVANLGGNKVALGVLTESIAGHLNNACEVQAVNIEGKNGYDFIVFFIEGSEADFGPELARAKLRSMTDEDFAFHYLARMPTNQTGKIDFESLRRLAVNLFPLI